MSSKVYLIRAKMNEGEESVSAKARKLFKAGGFEKCFMEKDFTAVKVHIGEDGNNTYIKPGFMKGLVDELLGLKVKPFITDTSTLYTGRRHNAIDHCILAAEHGFDVNGLGIPFIAPDGLFGTAESSVRIDAELNEEVSIAADILMCQSILSVAHFTGHIATSAAATIKTLGMGCASRKGKMRQHSALKPQIGDECVLCGQCAKHCPTDAITLGDVKAHIDADKCIGCAECVAVCRFDAVKYDWGREDETLQKDMAEHAKGVLAGKKGKAAFFNYVMSVTDECDCLGQPDLEQVVDDIGIVASTDPVAVDKASLDLVEKQGGRKMADLIGKPKTNPQYQMAHAEKIGLGSTDYELTEISG